MKQRVVFLEVLPTIAGGQKVLIDLLSGDFPFEAHVLLPGRGPLADRLTTAGAICHCTPMGQYTLVHKTLADWVRYANELPRLVKPNHPINFYNIGTALCHVCNMVF